MTRDDDRDATVWADGDERGSTLARWRGLIGIAGRRVFRRLLESFPNRTVLSVIVIGIAIALTVIVSGVSLGIASGNTVYGEGVDYWVVPESGTTRSTLLSVEGPQLGQVHDRSAAIRRIRGVSGATPVLVELIRLRGEDSTEAKYVLGVGVVPSGSDETIASVSTATLTPGDPFYANGQYNGEFTGEVVLSTAAAQQLNASTSNRLAAGGLTTTRIQTSYTVTAIDSSGPSTVQGQLPVAVFHLSELQRLTGADVGDHADQILVRTNRPAVRSDVQAVYPDAAVVTRTSLTTRQLFDSKLPLALSIAAGIIGFVVSTLFLATTMGLEVDADRTTLGVFAALGFSTRARLLMVLTSTFVLALVGSLVGVVLGSVGIFVVNTVATTQLGTGTVAVFHPMLPVMAVVLALVVAVFAAPYPLVVAWRTDPLSEVSR